MKEIFYRVITGGMLIAWMLLIFSYSSEPAEASNETSGGVCYRLVSEVNQLFHMELDEEETQKIAEAIEYPVRKAAHMTEYAILGLLSFAFYFSFNLRGKKVYFASLLTAVAYASTDEIHQLFVPGRSGMVTDVMIDTAGAAIGLLLLFFIRKFIGKHCEKKKVHVQ